MIRFGVFTLIATVLQLGVPSYGLRLVRRFGTHNGCDGWDGWGGWGGWEEALVFGDLHRF